MRPETRYTVAVQRHLRLTRRLSHMLAFTVGLTIGCGVEKPMRPTDQAPTLVVAKPTRELDVLFVVSDFMRTWVQQSLAKEMPAFIDAIAAGQGGLPELHLGVASASMGAGAFSSTVPGCLPGTSGDGAGRLQIPSSCQAPVGNMHFVIASPDGPSNLAGDLRDMAACMVELGGMGCGIQQPLAAARRALEKGSQADDPDNGGFLRSQANLAIVIVTNIDDCSLPADSTLFDPDPAAVGSPDDPAGLGALSIYRCSEFGHLCDGTPPPHAVAASQPLSNCVSAEERGRLVPVKTFVDFVEQLKPGRSDRLLLAAVTGPAAPYVVSPRSLLDGWPGVDHSCRDASGGPAWGSPGVRIRDAIGALAQPRNLLRSSCDLTHLGVLPSIAEAIHSMVNPTGCLGASIAERDPGSACLAFEDRVGAAGVTSSRLVPVCRADRSALPCWEISADPTCAAIVDVCYDESCHRENHPEEATVSLYCSEA